jgi:hypothetical protein
MDARLSTGYGPRLQNVRFNGIAIEAKASFDDLEVVALPSTIVGRWRSKADTRS